MFRQDIARWKEDDKRFVESHSYPYMLVKARNQPFVTFVGVPGSGKTATARHIALILQKEGYEILPIADKKRSNITVIHTNPKFLLLMML